MLTHSSDYESLVLALQTYIKGNVSKYLRYYMINDADNFIVGVLITAEDIQSCSLLNLSVANDIGVLALCLLMEILVKKQFKYFDAGVSAPAGYYKNKIFLDTKPVKNINVELLNRSFWSGYLD